MSERVCCMWITVALCLLAGTIIGVAIWSNAYLCLIQGEVTVRNIEAVSSGIVDIVREIF